VSTITQNDTADQIYYVYLLIDPRNNLPFYVGKGTGQRAKSHYYNWTDLDKHNPHKARKIKKIKSLGYKPRWEIVFESKNEQEVFNKENELINNGILTNIALGGCGPLRGSILRKQVDQYDLFGNFIQTFSSCAAAAKSCGKPNSSRISVCCSRKGKIRAAHGFLWSHHGIPLDLEFCIEKSRRYFVYQWDLEGNFIARYPSLAAATNKERASTNVLFAIDHCTSAYGFQWTRENNSPGKYIPSPRREVKYETVYQWDLNGKLLNTHISLYHVILSLGLKTGRSNIQRAIKTKRSAYNFQWTLTNRSPGIYKKPNYNKQQKEAISDESVRV
jgi:hypothetical protein